MTPARMREVVKLAERAAEKKLRALYFECYGAEAASTVPPAPANTRRSAQ